MTALNSSTIIDDPATFVMPTDKQVEELRIIFGDIPEYPGEYIELEIEKQEYKDHIIIIRFVNRFGGYSMRIKQHDKTIYKHEFYFTQYKDALINAYNFINSTPS